MTMPYLRIIGDVHGKIRTGHGRSYKKLAQAAFNSLQVGDLGFHYEDLQDINPVRNRVIGGNHDNYGALTPHYLGNHGVFYLSDFELFFVRGAFSIDYRTRFEGVDLFQLPAYGPDGEWGEQLTVAQAEDAIDAYQLAAPDIMVTHEAPEEIVDLICNNDKDLPSSFTQKVLQTMFAYHQPKIWIFGHWHENWRCSYDGIGVTRRGKQIVKGPYSGTTFICLKELGYIDLDTDGTLLTAFPQ